MPERTRALRALATSSVVESAGSCRLCTSSSRLRLSERVATKTRLPTWSSMSSCWRKRWPSMSLAVLLFCARVMSAQIQMLSASRRWRCTMASRVAFSSLTPGASTMTAPVLSTSHGPHSLTSLTMGQKDPTLTSPVESTKRSTAARSSVAEVHTRRLLVPSACVMPRHAFSLVRRSRTSMFSVIMRLSLLRWPLATLDEVYSRP
mmetsp:Transcript_12408/g.38296  ORF Transcript_12408/g.38296 Transcript_12408/m.38296 type:complete len:205 (+) Transcript_12408:1526-2140(+)